MKTNQVSKELKKKKLLDRLLKVKKNMHEIAPTSFILFKSVDKSKYDLHVMAEH